MESHISIRLPDDIEQGAERTDNWDVDIIQTVAKREVRNLRGDIPRKTFDISYGLSDEGNIPVVKNFFQITRGSWLSFLFKDWGDHSSAINTFTPIDATDQVLRPIFANDGDTRTNRFQIVKKVTVPNLPAEFRHLEYTHTITKPIASSVIVSGTNFTFNVDESTGVITFSNLITPSDSLTCGFEYNVPVRLEQSALTTILQLEHAERIPSIPLIEVLGE